MSVGVSEKYLPVSSASVQRGELKGFHVGDARSFFALTSKITPLGSLLNFDVDVKKTTARHQRENRVRARMYLLCAPYHTQCNQSTILLFTPQYPA